MEAYLQLGIMSLAVIAVLLILVEFWIKRRRHKMTEISIRDAYSVNIQSQDNLSESTSAISEENITSSYKVNQSPSAQKSTSDMDDILVISVLAKPNTSFESYDLLQAITATGMQFGEMNIFHYYLPTNEGRKALFSLASATKPGDFNLDNMGDFSCIGLTLFMDLKAVEDPEFAFSLMFKTAEQLTDDLDGQLRAGVHTPWSPETLQRYQDRVAQYQQA